MSALITSTTLDVSVITEVIGFVKEALGLLLTTPAVYFLAFAIVGAALGVFAKSKRAAQ